MSSPSVPPPSRRQLREFGLLIGTVFLVILGWALPALHGHSFRLWTLWVAIPALVLGLLWPRGLHWPYRGWMALGDAMGWVNSHMVLGLVYVLVLQPIALLMRILGHDPLRKKRSAVASYREEKTSTKKVNLTRIF